MTEPRPFSHGGYIPNPEESKVSPVFGWSPGEIIKKRDGRAWKIQFRDGEPWAIRSPEHDTEQSQ